MFFAYVLQNLIGKFYIGHTDDLETRLANHNRTDAVGGKFARKHRRPRRGGAFAGEEAITGFATFCYP